MLRVNAIKHQEQHWSSHSWNSSLSPKSPQKILVIIIWVHFIQATSFSSFLNSLCDFTHVYTNMMPTWKITFLCLPTLKTAKICDRVYGKACVCYLGLLLLFLFSRVSYFSNSFEKYLLYFTHYVSAVCLKAVPESPFFLVHMCHPLDLITVISPFLYQIYVLSISNLMLVFVNYISCSSLNWEI